MSDTLYLRAYASVPEARASLDRYLAFDNSRRPLSNRRENDPPDRFLIRLILDGKTPDQAYFNPLMPVPVAA